MRLHVLLVAALSVSSVAFAAPAKTPHGMVVSVQHEAADAGLAILKQGGNAVDAAVATGFALAVAAPWVGNLGGGGFMLVRDHTGATHFLDFREKGPGAATANMYLDAQGEVVKGLSTRGYKAMGVPGSVAGLTYARKHFGKLTLAQDMAPAIRLATDGYVLTAEEAGILAHATNLPQFPESKRIFQRDGDLYKGGETFKQPELAKTLTRIAADPEEFYKGAMAKQIADWVSSHGGILTAADLAAYEVKDRRPLVGQFRARGVDYDVLTAPPPSSGGIVLIETLNILSGIDLAAAGADRSTAQIHLITEAFRRAFMDRSDYLGDPDFSAIPIAEMESMKYAAAWRAGIDPAKPTPSAELKRPAGFLPAPPSAGPEHKESQETTHFSIVDKDGNAVAMTTTLNGYFGCGVTVEGLGFLLNNEMDDFSAKPGSPNMFGLIQGPANAVGPGHRPLSSMTPTMVTTHAAGGRGKLVLVAGSPGGSTIPTTVTSDVISILVNGLSVQAAADGPRFHHQYLPDVLDVEKAFPLETVAALRAMGYKVSRANEADEKNPGVWGDSELIEVNQRTGALEAGHDSRHTYGKAASY